MEIMFSRDYKHNYLVIKDERVLEDNYQFKMMAKNNLEGTVACSERMINGEGLLYYDVTSKQSFKNIFELKTIGIEDIRLLFKQLKKTCDNLSKYLLYGEELILDPEYIFLDMETREYSFVFYPFGENDYNIFNLLNYIVERLNPDDMEATKAIYELIDMVDTRKCSLEEALIFFWDEYAKENEESVYCEEITKEQIEYLNEEAKEPKVSESFFRRLIKRLFVKEKEDDESDEFDWAASFYEGESEWNNSSKDTSSNEGTVYIPWNENGENKLYGMGKNNKYHIDLTKGTITVGKLAGNVDLVINDNSISRMHARFFMKGSKYYMSDLNSTNGTFINGRRLNPNETCLIEAGDEIGLGRLKFIYR